MKDVTPYSELKADVFSRLTFKNVVYFNKFVLCCVVALVQQVKERELD
jgi:hypothetical protein